MNIVNDFVYNLVIQFLLETRKTFRIVRYILKDLPNEELVEVDGRLLGIRPNCRSSNVDRREHLIGNSAKTV